MNLAGSGIYADSLSPCSKSVPSAYYVCKINSTAFQPTDLAGGATDFDSKALAFGLIFLASGRTNVTVAPLESREYSG